VGFAVQASFVTNCGASETDGSYDLPQQDASPAKMRHNSLRQTPIPLFGMRKMGEKLDASQGRLQREAIFAEKALSLFTAAGLFARTKGLNPVRVLLGLAGERARGQTACACLHQWRPAGSIPGRPVCHLCLWQLHHPAGHLPLPN
jgi:hypothetical protein